MVFSVEVVCEFCKEMVTLYWGGTLHTIKFSFLMTELNGWETHNNFGPDYSLLCFNFDFLNFAEISERFSWG